MKINGYHIIREDKSIVVNSLYEYPYILLLCALIYSTQQLHFMLFIKHVICYTDFLDGVLSYNS